MQTLPNSILAHIHLHAILGYTLSCALCGEVYSLSDVSESFIARWGVVQPVGHLTVNEDGEGSNPSAPANLSRRESQAIVSRRPPLTCPVLNMQTRDPAELALIIGNEDQFATDGLRRDQRIQRTDGCAGTLELRPHLSIRS